MGKTTGVVLFLLMIILSPTAVAPSVPEANPPTPKCNIETIKERPKQRIEPKTKKPKTLITLSVSAYAHHGRTASGLRLEEKHSHKLVALSPCLARRFKFGRKLKLIVGDKTFNVEYHDIMSKKWKQPKADIYISSLALCQRWGVKKAVLVVD